MCVVDAPLIFKKQTHRISPSFLNPVASRSLFIYWMREKAWEQRLVTNPLSLPSQDALPTVMELLSYKSLRL